MMIVRVASRRLLRAGAIAVCAAAAAPARAEPAREPLQLGSYGRLSVGSDLRGGTPEAVNVVLHGARIVESTYLELDVKYARPPAAAAVLDWRVVATIAFAGDPFHYTGEFDHALALRNLYLEVALDGATSVWAGARSYRGDDVYLLDFWPLDDLNTIGGGVRFACGRVEAAAHAGVNRLLDEFQFQEIEVPDPEFGSTTRRQLDRQRFLASATGAYRLIGSPAGPAVKAKLHAETHAVPSGARRRDDLSLDELPADFGWLAGVQLGAWGFAPRGSHASLFLRFAQGLAAFDELRVPDGLDVDERAFPGATELVAGAAGTYEIARGGVMLGAYARRFVDADPRPDDRDDGWEYIADVRPYAAVTEHLHAAVDLSYQQRFPRGASPTALEVLSPGVAQIAPMLVLSTEGLGAYARPQLRLVYRAAHLDEGARDLYPLEDPRRDRAWVHFLGFQAEWWVDSTYR
jgi:maltoporin